jgi:Fuc2NAc and GlcNAc transferase
VVDTLITLVRRVLRGDRWHESHRSHAYQHATTYLGNHKRALFGVLIINLFWLTPLMVVAQTMPDYIVIFVVVAFIPLVALALYFGAGSKTFTRRRLPTAA